MKLLAILLALGPSLLASPVIDDRALRGKFQRALAEAAEREGHVTGRALVAQLKDAQGRKAGGAWESPFDGRMRYDDEVKGVVMVGSVYKCGKCDQWHLGGVATGWVASADGVIVTNHHVIAKAEHETYGVMTLDGRFSEVIKVIAASKEADIAVLQVGGEGFSPLRVADKVGVGDTVHVISHPDGRFFTYTSGRVSRFFAGKAKNRDQRTTWMAITADYAKGSSGGPVFNDRGEVVGMVSSTNTIYYGAKPDGGARSDPKGPAQMVVKNCVSLRELRALLGMNVKVGKTEE